MALSGSLNTSSYDGRYYQLSWTATQDVSTNKSTISWTLKATGGNANWYAERTVKVVIAGTTVFSKTDRVERYAETIKTGTITLEHNTDGTKSFSASVQAAVYGTSINCTGSSTFTLNTIARKSTLTVSNGTLGTAQTLTVTRNSTSFTHTITYTCGSASGTIATKSSSTSISFTPPTSLASQASSGSSVSITFKIETFNGSTSLGSNSYTKTFAIPSSVAPTVSLSVSDANGYATTYGGYVKGKSAFKITVTASGKEGSTISSYKVTADGKTYTSASVTTGVVNSTGTQDISVIVTDSRGRTATASTTVTVLDYIGPKVTELSTYRSNSSGTADNKGSYLCVKFSSEISSLNSKNTATYKVLYRKRGASSYTTATVTKYNNNYNVSSGTYVFSADTSTSYDVKLEVSDAFMTITKKVNGSSIAKLFSVFGAGLGLAFGKLAELEDYLEVAFKARFYQVVEMQSGSNYKNNNNIYFENGSGNLRSLVHMNANDDSVYGYGSYENSDGTAKYCGYNINFMYKNKFLINGVDPFANKVLWSHTGHQMGSGTTATLSENITAQKHGIVIVFSGYDTTTSKVLNYRWNSYFIPKHVVSANDGTQHSFAMSVSDFTLIGAKALTIYDGYIAGQSANTKNGTNSGVTYNNNNFVMRYVIGV